MRTTRIYILGAHLLLAASLLTGCATATHQQSERTAGDALDEDPLYEGAWWKYVLYPVTVPVGWAYYQLFSPPGEAAFRQ